MPNPPRANVFLINASLGPEDRLTACWHYVLSVVPGLGQAFVEHIAEQCRLPNSKFIGAVNHPTGNRSNHPDLLIRCRDYDVLFEHKLDSPLGPGQLERYLAFARQRGWKLALLGSRRTAIPGTVCGSPAFVCPQDPRQPRHFLWQDVHQILASSEHHLAREFRQFLESWGLARLKWAGLGDPFVDDGAAHELRELFRASIPRVFPGIGVSCRIQPNSLVFEVRRPFPPIHLINIGPIPSVAQWDGRIWGPVMALWTWVGRRGLKRRLLSSGAGEITGVRPKVLFADTVDLAPLPYKRSVYAERDYYVPLASILCGSRAASERRLTAFVRTTVEHLRDECSRMRNCSW